MEDISLFEDYLKVREQSENMCAPLHTEDYIPQAAFFASPPKWNLAHTTWFFEEMILKNYQENYRVFNDMYSYLFNSYYNTIGERTKRNQRGNLSRPFVNEVYTYRRYVDQEMKIFLKKELDDKVKKLVRLGINHEQQHQELFFTDLKYTFSENPLYPSYNDIPYAEKYRDVEKGELNFDGGLYEFGYNEEGFCFDNELPVHKVHIYPFKISKSLVTNSEFLDFMYDEGYKRFDLWHDDGFNLFKSEDIKKPMYWKLKDGEWFQYTLGGLRELKPDAPVTHITYYEAAAFARWKGMRLPTEFEWELASSYLTWGDRWEWTESAYLPYPGYKISGGAVGEYNGKFMVNQKVLRGFSIVTPEGHQRKTYRNFFHPNMGWQFNGIRLAKDN